MSGYCRIAFRTKWWRERAHADADIAKLIGLEHEVALGHCRGARLARHNVDGLLADVRQPVVPRHVRVPLHGHLQTKQPRNVVSAQISALVDCTSHQVEQKSQILMVPMPVKHAFSVFLGTVFRYAHAPSCDTFTLNDATPCIR